MLSTAFPYVQHFWTGTANTSDQSVGQAMMTVPRPSDSSPVCPVEGLTSQPGS